MAPTNHTNGHTGEDQIEDSNSIYSSARSGWRALTSSLVGRWEWAQRFGLSFDGKRDMAKTLGYAEKLYIRDYRGRYRRGGVAKRIITAFPSATWAGGARIAEDTDPKHNTPFELVVRQIFKRLRVWSRLTRADILAGLGRYSVILIGAGGSLDSPMPEDLSTPGSIRYLTPLAEDHAGVERFDEDPSSPRFGQPLFYQVNLGVTSVLSPTNTSTFLAARVHWTRVIHVAEGLLEDDVYGEPRLEAVWNRLDDLDKVIGGGAEAAWQRMQPGMQLDLDPAMKLGETEEKKLSDEIDEYVHGMRRFMRTRGVKLNQLSQSVAGFGPNADSIMEQISATTGIPLRILTGSERGELASTQDRLNWNDRIDERRRSFATPLVQQLIERFIRHHALPDPSPVNTDGAVSTTDGFSYAAHPGPGLSALAASDPDYDFSDMYEIVWPEVGRVDDSTKAAVIGKVASANQAQANTGQPIIMTTDEIRHTFLGLGPHPPDVVAANPQQVSGDLGANPANQPGDPAHPAVEPTATAGAPNPGGNL